MSANWIPYGRQDIDGNDIEAVVEVLTSDFLTQGPVVPRFEEALAAYCGVEHAVAANSATSALHMACLALGVGPGDRVWTSPVTFVASANCALYCGAEVDFVDIDPQTCNLSVIALEEKLRHARAGNCLPKVVIPVHLAGQSCDMQAIARLAEEFGFAVIEDAAHAIGGRYHQRPVGDCRYSDITVFSFHPVKIITTAEGGVATTMKAELAERMRDLRSHGITRDRGRLLQDDGPWYYEQQSLGFNYRMTEIQAALGLSQMTRLDSFVERRSELARQYDRLLDGMPLMRQEEHPHSDSSWHLYIVRLAASAADAGRHRQVFDALRHAGIGVNLHYIPVHLQPYYRGLGFRQGDFPHAEDYYRRAISLPLYPGLTQSQQDHVVASLGRALAP